MWIHQSLRKITRQENVEKNEDEEVCTVVRCTYRKEKNRLYETYAAILHLRCTTIELVRAANKHRRLL